MSEQPARSYTRLAIAVIVAALVIGAAIFASSYFGTATTVTRTTTATKTITTSITSYLGNAAMVSSNVTNGLQLTAIIKPVNVPLGSNVTVTAQVYNTLSSEVEVNASSMTNQADGPCQQDFATGVEVYQGLYTTANLSVGFVSNPRPTEYLLYNPSLTYVCPRSFVFLYSFSPGSDVATVQQGPGGPSTTGPVNEISVLDGYWTSSGQGQQDYTFHTFPQGTYTVVVFDAWGQTAFGYFQVASSVSSTSTVTSTLTVSSTVVAVSSTSSTTAETTCIITGQPAGFFLRVVSDADQTPIAGVQVTAINQPATVSGGGLPACLATNQASLTFTTNNTEWYSLGSQNNAGYSLYVRYLGQSYNFTADLRPLSVTCASLYIPSGETNVTITEFQTTCPQTITTTTTG